MEMLLTFHRISVISMCFLSLFTVQYVSFFPNPDNMVTILNGNTRDLSVDKSGVENPANDFSDEQFFFIVNTFGTNHNMVRRNNQIESKTKNTKLDLAEPMTFIDSLESKKHILLVSDDPKRRKTIEFYFIKKGLEKAERCIYLTHGEIEHIENDMVNFGINVIQFKKKNLLHVYKIPNPIENSVSILDGANNMLKQVLKNPQAPFRIVGRIIDDIGMEEAISIQLYLEKRFHDTFETLNGSVMCTYDFFQIQENNRWHYWLDSLAKYHHVLVSSRNGKNTVTSYG
jgi:MEDS: MEthanogen/methylotroph, DcmR Sensory domain